MCNNCNCEAYDQCSIVGYLPVGFCCSKCYLYNEEHTCLESRTKNKVSKIEPVSATIEDGVLKVVIKKDEKEVPLIIDLDKHLGSE
ncbi:MAG TPA: hypothetical protein VMV43_05815 [Candidatus Nanopelagicaceae bacterium]|jgi:hypothetical protein|nr:hypothetical protein [Candidatus Nanopelagicaceae bacterium]